MELLVVGIVCVLSILGVTFASLRFYSASEQGWAVAINTLSSVNENQTVRITTLENRLQSRSVEEFAEYQNVPDELTKTTLADINRRDYAYGQERDEMLRSEGVSQGEDLEGIDIGHTIG